MTLTELQRTVLACNRCSPLDRIPTPRHGTGNGYGPTLMIVAQNPPQDPERGLQGAYLLHYPEDVKRGPHERLVAELVASLGLTPDDVWATQAVKCPTIGNKKPSLALTGACADYHLRYEISVVHPKVILAFGEVAPIAVGKDGHPTYFYQVSPVGRGHPGYVRLYANGLIEAPHPSKVVRFLQKESWLSAIQATYTMAILRARGSTGS